MMLSDNMLSDNNVSDNMLSDDILSDNMLSDKLSYFFVANFTHSLNLQKWKTAKSTGPLILQKGKNTILVVCQCYTQVC
jgi:hypothetical protein